MPKIVLAPEIGVKYDPNTSYIDLRERAMAACATAESLVGEGFRVSDVTSKDLARVEKSVLAYAEAPHNKIPPPATPQALLLTGQILREYGREVVTSALHIRHLVTNKLILETEDGDPKVRLKALELLGKISDVGLFSDKSEVTVTHQSADDLRAKLRQKLERVIDVTPEHIDEE